MNTCNIPGLVRENLRQSFFTYSKQIIPIQRILQLNSCDSELTFLNDTVLIHSLAMYALRCGRQTCSMCSGVWFLNGGFFFS